MCWRKSDLGRIVASGTLLSTICVDQMIPGALLL